MGRRQSGENEAHAKYEERIQFAAKCFFCNGGIARTTAVSASRSAFRNPLDNGLTQNVRNETNFGLSTFPFRCLEVARRGCAEIPRNRR